MGQNRRANITKDPSVMQSPVCTGHVWWTVVLSLKRGHLWKPESFLAGHCAGTPQVRRRGRTEHNLRWTLAEEGKTLKDRTEMNVREANRLEEEKRKGEEKRKRYTRTHT